MQCFQEIATTCGNFQTTLIKKVLKAVLRNKEQEIYQKPLVTCVAMVPKMVLTKNCFGTLEQKYSQTLCLESFFFNLKKLIMKVRLSFLSNYCLKTGTATYTWLQTRTLTDI